MFDGAKAFAGLCCLLLGGAVLAFPVAGWAGIAGVLGALFVLLTVANSFERRDIRDDSKPKRRRR